MRFLCYFIILSCSIFNLSSSTFLECSYEYWSFAAIGSIYHCEIQTDLNIISPESAVIVGADGPHHGPKTNDNVAGFYVNNKNFKINFFPLGLEKFFKNLRLVFIHHSQIKELHQSDLMNLTKLEYLSITDGYIQVLEEGLFDFNPDLLYISFEDNRISQISSNIFNKLTKLTHLSLNGNRCKFSNAKNVTEIQKLIPKIKASCPLTQGSSETEELRLQILDNSEGIVHFNLTAESTAGSLSIPQIYYVVVFVFMAFKI